MSLLTVLSTSNTPHSVDQAGALTPTFTYHILQNYTEVTKEIQAHFAKNDTAFYPALSSRGPISDYIQSIFRADGRLIICQTRRRVVGALGICLNHPDWEYYFQYMAVDEDYRRRGLQEKMLETAIRLFREAGATRIVTRTWSANQASQGFFRKHGFIHFDTIFDDRGKGVHTCLFTKVLAPIILEKPVQFLGLIGGMRPLGTGNYIKTLTSIPCHTLAEQPLLPFLVVNDPFIFDRNDDLDPDQIEAVVARVKQSIHLISHQAVSHLIILSFTFHPFIPLLSLNTAVEVIDLIGVCHELLRRQAGKWLLVATKSTYAMNSFALLDVHHPAEYDERERIHAIITEIKSGASAVDYRFELIAIAKNNDCSAILLGCTDLHGMFGFHKIHQGIAILDPLLELALHLETIRQRQNVEL